MSHNYNILTLLNIQCKFTILSKKSIIDKCSYIEVHLDYKRTPHRCPHCHKHSSFIIKERPTQKIKWLPCSGRRVCIILRKTRWKCKCCNHTFTPAPKYINRYNRISNDIKYKIAIELATTHSLTSIARKYNISVNTVIRVMKSNFKSTKPHHTRKLPKVILIDEFKSTKNAKGNMSFIIIDGDTGKIFDIVESRKLYYLRRYFHKFSKEKRNDVQYVAMDMYSPYIELVNQVFMNATICFDRFHVVNHLSRALIKTRIKVMKRYNTKTSEYKLLKKHWKLLQKNEDDLNDLEYKPRKPLRYEQLTTRQFAHRIAKIDKELWSTYRAYQDMLYIFKYEDYNRFDVFSEKILNNNEVSYEFKSALNTLVVYRKYVINNLKFGYNTGKVENTIRFIKQMKNNAFGFRSYENMKRRILIKFNLLKHRTA